MKKHRPLVLATRKSALARQQAETVAMALRRLGEEVQILPLTTTGDEICDRPLTAIGGKELFIRALQEAVISQKADFAVHSLKDMAAGDTNTGLCLAAVGFGESANDALVVKKKLKELPPNAVIGSCSPRRAALLRHIAPQLKVKALRGNVQTRLDKLAMGEFDAIILAAAGLKRLGLSRYIGEILPTDSFIPAVGQGLLGIECLADNKLLCEKISGINNPLNMRRAVAERAFAAAIGGDCNTPLGAYAKIHNEECINFCAFYESPSGAFLDYADNTPMKATDAGLRAADNILRRLP